MKIAHIAQTHSLPPGRVITRATFERAVMSQFRVAQLILQNPHCPVVCEGWPETKTFHELQSLGEDITWGSHKVNLKTIRNIFPRGLPNRIEELNTAQKSALYVCGAAVVLLFLNEIPILYKSGENETTNEIVMPFLKKEPNTSGISFEAIQEFREEQAIRAVKTAAEIHYKKVEESSIVILVYGAAHNFQSLCTTNKLQYKKIYTHAEQAKNYSQLNFWQPADNDWLPEDFCDKSKLDMDKIQRQGPRFSPQTIGIGFSLLSTALGATFLSLYFLINVANPIVALISGILFVAAGLALGLYLLFADCLSDRFKRPPAMLDVQIVENQPTTSLIP